MTTWITAQQDAAIFWQGAFKTYIKTSLATMENLNKLMSASLPFMSASLPMMREAFKLGEAQMKGMATMQDTAKDTANEAARRIESPVNPADPLESVPMTLATLPHTDGGATPFPFKPASGGVKAPYTR